MFLAIAKVRIFNVTFLTASNIYANEFFPKAIGHMANFTGGASI